MEDKLIRKAYSEMKKSLSQDNKCPEEYDFCRFLEGGMDEVTREAIEKHLLSCQACTDLVISLNKVIHFPAEEELFEIPNKQIEKARALMQGKEEGVKEKGDILRFVKEILSFNWLAHPMPVLVRSGAATVAMVLIFFATYLYMQQNVPLSMQLQVMGREGSIITRGTAPAIKEKIIQEGDILYSKDFCRVSFELSRDAFAYVFYYDSGGELHQLYPDPAVTVSQKVAGKKTYTLPAGEDSWFQLDNQSGTETVFMLASTRPITNLGELSLAAKGLNRDEVLKAFEDSAPVFKVLNFIHQ